ncbi:MAG: hypothetical protein FWG34_09310 [Oscillospiraceae bacterium]|nr:hypothetical protein [Oscillospiraceae bacterium]
MKKSKIKKLMNCVILILLLSFVLQSCQANSGNDGGNSPDVINNADKSDALPDEKQPEPEITDSLPDGLDFNGEEFRIVTCIGSERPHLTLLFDSETITGDALEDAVYNRNRKLEERFNAVIRQIEVSDFINTMKRSILADDGLGEVYALFDHQIVVFGTESLLIPMKDVPYIDMNKKYWDKSINDSLSIGGAYLFIHGDYNFSTYDYTRVLLFNKNLNEDLGLENPYGLVKNGKWTVDKFAEMGKASLRDLNGNDTYDDGDCYGYLAQPKSVLPCFWIASGIQTVPKDKDDIPFFDIKGNAKFEELVSKIFTITWDDNIWWRNTNNDSAASQIYHVMFENNQSLFLDSTFKNAGQLRNMDANFGILPYPKYNEEQEVYYTRVEGGLGGAIPKTNINLELTGAMLEAMSCESIKSTIPLYYEVALKTKTTRDEESAEMLDMIFNNRVYDLGDTFWTGYIRDGFLNDMFLKNNRNLASQIEANETKVNLEIQKTIDALLAQ